MDICNGIKEVILSNLPQILKLRTTGRLKPDNSFVSDGDLLCQKLIFDWIEKNVNSSYIIISEEAENNLAEIDDVEFVITVDPIDGTENYISGLKEWGVGLSVYHKGIHYQSMILLPEMNICVCTGEKIEKIKTSRICGLSSYMTPKDFETLEKSFEYRIMGCCMYNMYNVIKGSYCRFQHIKGCYSWDILPGLNIAIENGLSVKINDHPYAGEFLIPGVKYKFTVDNL